MIQHLSPKEAHLAARLRLHLWCLILLCVVSVTSLMRETPAPLTQARGSLVDSTPSS